MPTIGRTWEEITAQAGDLGWSHEEYLAEVWNVKPPTSQPAP